MIGAQELPLFTLTAVSSLRGGIRQVAPRAGLGRAPKLGGATLSAFLAARLAPAESRSH